MPENLSMEVWEAIEGMVSRKVSEMTADCLRARKAQVTDPYDTNTKLVGVTEPFGQEIHIPVGGNVRPADLTVGKMVWIMLPYSDLSNAFVWKLGDGKPLPAYETSIEDVSGLFTWNLSQSQARSYRAIRMGKMVFVTGGCTMTANVSSNQVNILTAGATIRPSANVTAGLSTVAKQTEYPSQTILGYSSHIGEATFPMRVMTDGKISESNATSFTIPSGSRLQFFVMYDLP